MMVTKVIKVAYRVINVRKLKTSVPSKTINKKNLYLLKTWELRKDVSQDKKKYKTYSLNTFTY